MDNCAASRSALVRNARAAADCGSAIVMGREGVEGIFTTVDACRALADVIHRATAESLGLAQDSL